MNPISIVIITYNRPKDTLELLQNISNLEAINELLHEVVLVNNASTTDYNDVNTFIKSNDKFTISYYYSNENLGVARGRNFALTKTTSPILIMLDDDCILENRDALLKISDEFSNNNTTRPKGIISFKVLYYESKQYQINAFPHKKFKSFKNRSFFETYYYAGGAHAIKREVLDKVGEYPVDFFYGMEEYDLSYRILDSGYSIVYSDSIIMLHKESPLGRKTKKEKYKMMWLNKSKVAWRYLPKYYFLSTAILWSIYFLVKSKLDFRAFIKGWQELSKIKRNNNRTPISTETIKYLQTLQARLYY